MKLCLVASTGGHLLQLVSLRKGWQRYDRFWVTFQKVDAETLLENERVIWAHHPTNRNLKNLVRNLALAWRVLKRERPDVVLSTGAGVGVPFLWVGRLLGMRAVYMESITCFQDLSLSGKLVYPWVDRFYVQWPDLARRYPRAIYQGSVL